MQTENNPLKYFSLPLGREKYLFKKLYEKGDIKNACCYNDFTIQRMQGNKGIHRIY